VQIVKDAFSGVQQDYLFSKFDTKLTTIDPAGTRMFTASAVSGWADLHHSAVLMNVSFSFLAPSFIDLLVLFLTNTSSYTIFCFCRRQWAGRR
jgi:hypothetical protein